MKIGNDVIIHKDVFIKRSNSAIIGNRVAIDKGFYCTSRLEIGDYVHISPYVTSIGGKGKSKFFLEGFNNIMVGARIICGSDRFDASGLPGALIPDELKGREIIQDVIVEKFANIGTNSIVLPGARLRKGVLLAAGSLLIGDTVEWGVYKGNPAKLVKIIDEKIIIEKARKLGYE